MAAGEIELRFHISMAGKTEVGVSLFQEMLRYRGSVNLVAVVAGHSTQSMDSSFGLKKNLALSMAAQAGIR